VRKERPAGEKKEKNKKVFPAGKGKREKGGKKVKSLPVRGKEGKSAV